MKRSKVPFDLRPPRLRIRVRGTGVRGFPDRLLIERTRSRGGWSLIEMLSVITLTTVLSVMCVQFIVLFLQVDSRTGVDALRELNLQRLEDQLRSDCRDVTTINVAQADNGSTLTIDRTDQAAAVYTVTPGVVARQSTTGEGENVHEVFTLAGHIVELELVQEAAGEVVRLSVFTVVEARKGPLAARLEAMVQSRGASR